MIKETYEGKRYVGTYIVEANEITIDKIRELKREGFHDEAEELFNFFRSDIKETKENLLVEIAKKDKEVKREAGICPILGCKNPSAEGKRICEHHLVYKKEYKISGPYKKEKKKPEKVIYCMICKKNVAVDYANIIKGTTKKWMCRFCHIEGKRERGLIK